MSTIKTVDDHCGYSFPWDPLQLITDNNAGYHDVHHQSWGIKTNFSQPYFTIWDRIMGTRWTGGDVSKRYERTRKAAEAKMGSLAKRGTVTASDPAESKRLADSDSEPDPITAMYAEMKPAAPAGKAAMQAAVSRRQVLDDKQGGGMGVMREEAAEEEREIARQQQQQQQLQQQSQQRRRTRNKSSSNAAEGSLKGLSDKVAGALHSGVGSVLKGADH
jgi:sphinganine C4-monooxygenase